MCMGGDACLPSNAYYPRTPDYILYTGVHVCWAEHSDSFVYGFMSLDYGLGTMTATAYLFCKSVWSFGWLQYSWQNFDCQTSPAELLVL